MVPRVMSTQHPDNARIPFFAASEVLNGEDEVREAYYVFSHFKCDEQMWDFEGKEADTHIVKKLLSSYYDFFSSRPLGKDFRLTMRVPNPEIEKGEAKLLAETLEMIPRSYDYVRSLGIEHPPIFEVILPMTRSAEDVMKVHAFYRDFVAGKGRFELMGARISDWLGDFLPEEIRVIPLFEDRDSLMRAAIISAIYAEWAELDELRVFLARSDPAMNYGFVAATIYVKKALYDLSQSGIPTYPILGVGSCPFRGGFSPKDLSVLDEFPSVYTFTVQSAFKYDYEFGDVRRAIKRAKEAARSRADYVDEKHLQVAEKLKDSYRRRIARIAEVVNRISSRIPRRRMRKLHVGLFGYSRGEEIKLPRAITFCASLYSIGLPPEIIGIAEMGEKDYEAICEVFRSFDGMMEAAMSLFNPESLKLVDLSMDFERAKEFFGYEPDERHLEKTSEIIKQIDGDVKNLVVEAGILRGFLG